MEPRPERALAGGPAGPGKAHGGSFSRRAGSTCFTVSRRPDLNVASSGRVRLPRHQILEGAGAPARRRVVGLPRDVAAL